MAGIPIDRSTVQKYVEAGLTQAEMVERWLQDFGEKKSRTAFAMAISRYGITPVRSRPRYDELLPWRVKMDHLMEHEPRMLRLLARRRRGLDISDDESGMLEKWIREMHQTDAVVAYEAETAQGWFLVPRLPTDEDFIRNPA